MSIVLCVFIGLIGGYLVLYNDLLRSARKSGFRCDKCDSTYCFAKRCWFYYNKLHKKGDKEK